MTPSVVHPTHTRNKGWTSLMSGGQNTVCLSGVCLGFKCFLSVCMSRKLESRELELSYVTWTSQFFLTCCTKCLSHVLYCISITFPSRAKFDKLLNHRHYFCFLKKYYWDIKNFLFNSIIPQRFKTTFKEQLLYHQTNVCVFKG